MQKFDPWPYIEAITKLATMVTALYHLSKDFWPKLKAVRQKLKELWERFKRNRKK